MPAVEKGRLQTLFFLNAFSGYCGVVIAAGRVIRCSFLLVRHLRKSKWGIFL